MSPDGVRNRKQGAESDNAVAGKEALLRPAIPVQYGRLREYALAAGFALYMLLGCVAYVIPLARIVTLWDVLY